MTIQEWYQQYSAITAVDRLLISNHIKALTTEPKLSLLTPVYNTNEQWLTKCITSVIEQAYPNWELCLCDNGCNPQTTKLLKQLANLDHRIKLIRLEKNEGGFGGTNAALEIATGDYIGFLDSDDELVFPSLYLIADLIQKHPDASVIYTDEVIVDGDSNCISPFFKPDFSPHLLMSQNCVSHLSFWRGDLLKWLKMKESAGSHDYDLTLRTMETVKWDTFYHIPYLAYKYRSHTSSVSSNTESYCIMGAVKALEEHLDRINRPAKVYYDWPWYRVKYELPEPPHVDILVASINKENILHSFVTNLLAKTDYPDFTLHICITDDIKPIFMKWFEALVKTGKIKLVPRGFSNEFNYSILANSMVSSADGPIICIMNDDIEPLNYNWLTEMVSLALQDETGIVGAKLLYSNMTYQHVGVILGIERSAAHVFKHHPDNSHGYFGRSKLVGNYSMVTGACWVMRKGLYDKVGGYDENIKVAYGDVDVCIKVSQLGLYNVYTPHASLLHKEAFSRGVDDTIAKRQVFQFELKYLQDKWGTLLESDPFYNPNLSLHHTNFELALPSDSRYKKPWML